MDKTIRLCSTSTGTDIREPIQGQTSTVTSLAISSNNACIVFGSEDRTVQMWDLNTGTAVGRPFKGHTRRVTSVAFSANGMLIASGSDDGTIRIWNTSAGAAVGEEFRGHTTHYIGRICSNNFSTLGSNDGGLPRSDTPEELEIGDSAGLFYEYDGTLQHGWIFGPGKELILWVPPAHREGLCYGPAVMVMGNVHRTQLDFRPMACGPNWSKCRRPLT